MGDSTQNAPMLEESAMAIDTPQVKSTVRAVARKGRGFRSEAEEPLSSNRIDGDTNAMSEDPSQGQAQRSVEGWVVIVTGVHEEATEEDLVDHFLDYGRVKDIHLNLDRRTGFVKGYALLEFAEYNEAKAAIDGANGTEFLGQPIACDFAFAQGQSSSYTQETRNNRR
ncbi:hypothetical protein H4R33_000315 [Dimargaris cristalligena]|nr:hypothetical protein H4R33_000315 [Dimargaris cristalligena]